MLSKQQLLAALSGLLTSVTFCPHVTLLPVQGSICMLLGAVKPMLSSPLSASIDDCVQIQHHTGFVFRDGTSVQQDLQTPDQSFSITYTQSVSTTACQFYNAWLYLVIQICTVILKLKTSDVVL